MQEHDFKLVEIAFEDFSSHHINLGTSTAVWGDNFELSVSNYKYKDTYVLHLKVGITGTYRNTTISISSLSKFVIHVPEFNVVDFYRENIELLVDMFSDCYTQARVFLSVKAVPDFKGVYLPFYRRADIKSKMAMSDIYNKLQ